MFDHLWGGWGRESLTLLTLGSGGNILGPIGLDCVFAYEGLVEHEPSEAIAWGNAAWNAA